MSSYTRQGRHTVMPPAVPAKEQLQRPMTSFCGAGEACRLLPSAAKHDTCSAHATKSMRYDVQILQEREQLLFGAPAEARASCFPQGGRLGEYGESLKETYQCLPCLILDKILAVKILPWISSAAKHMAARAMQA